MGDILTYHIFTDDTLQVINRSVVRPVDPKHPNHRVHFDPTLDPTVANRRHAFSSDPTLQFDASRLKVDPTISNRRRARPPKPPQLPKRNHQPSISVPGATTEPVTTPAAPRYPAQHPPPATSDILPMNVPPPAAPIGEPFLATKDVPDTGEPDTSPSL